VRSRLVGLRNRSLAFAILASSIVLSACGGSDGSAGSESGSATGSGSQSGNAATLPAGPILPPTGSITLAPVQFAHTLNPQITALCLDLGWFTCNIPEYTDDQALMGDTKDTYGPYALVVPSPSLQNITSPTAFGTNGTLVAFVYVAEGPRPSTYTELGLVSGFTCFYLKHDGTNLRAFVSPAAPGCALTAPTAAVEHPLKVAAMPTGFPAATDIPGVARFHEGNKGNSKGRPAIGWRCATAWCVVLPLPTGGSNADTLGLWHKSWLPQTWRTSAVHGWHDVQTVALPPATSPGALQRSTLEMAVVPTPELRDYNDNHTWPMGTWVHAATVVVPKTPVGKYLNSWQFAIGHNMIFLRKTGARAFEARLMQYVVGPDGNMNLAVIRNLPLTRRQHANYVPSTARFMWSPSDEDLWISCEMGCCMVSSGDG
jgi:hypothetical protein